jgi:hypothetical protein
VLEPFRATVLASIAPREAAVGESPLIVKPDTVVRWHRKGVRLALALVFRCKRVGRPTTAHEVRTSLPCIHGQLLSSGPDFQENRLPIPVRGCIAATRGSAIDQDPGEQRASHLGWEVPTMLFLGESYLSGAWNCDDGQRAQCISVVGCVACGILPRISAKSKRENPDSFLWWSRLFS